MLSSKAINRDTLITQVPKIVQARGNVSIEVVGDNIFLADFASQIDRNRVLSDGPWHFFNSLMAFKEPKDIQNPSQVEFDDFTVWVQLHNLPFLCMHKSVIEEIGSIIGTVREVDMGADGSCMGKFARVRVSRPLMQPLQRCVNAALKDGGPKNLILLLYERVPDFCYACGRVGHVLRDCWDTTVDKRALEFGVWMRAGRVDFIRTNNPPRAGNVSSRGSSIAKVSSPVE